MSQWTHVAGCIRVDCLRVIPAAGMPHKEQLEEILVAGLPTGSEGPLAFAIHENPMPEHLAAFAVMVFGDLRDFGPDDVSGIEAWMDGVAARLKPERDIAPGEFPGYIRNAILEVAVEFHGERVWRWDSGNGGRWVELSIPDRKSGES